MKLQPNFSLLEYNTFHVPAHCRWFTAVSDTDSLLELLRDARFEKLPKLILGGGSNLLFTKDFEGLVIKNNFKGIEKVSEDDDVITFKVGAGENWHDFVTHTVNLNLGGIENLSLIPGNVGASPMQNIGAYGVEVKDVIEKVETIDMTSGEIEYFNVSDCQFGYRTSIFKTTLKNRKFISQVYYRLHKDPVLNTTYGSISDELEKMKIAHITVKDVSRAVINIRQSKLPDPKVLGNAGSFFKNPVVPAQLASDLLKTYPEMPVYDADSGQKKIPAGWLIEKLGWKGKRIKDFGVHVKQALVLVNYGSATGADIIDLADQIVEDIHKTYGIELEKEVNIL